MRCSGNMCNRWPSVRGQEWAGRVMAEALDAYW
jgi:hypothetical protein